MNLEDIWGKYKVQLRLFLHKNISNPEDVDDLLQEILIKTYENLLNLRDHKKIKSWLFQIAHHCVIDFYRKKSSKTEKIAQELGDEEIEDTVRKELSMCITPFIQALPEEDSVLLTAIEITGISQKDYANKMGVKYSTLKSKVKKSRTALHRLFNECCHFSMDRQGNIIDFKAKNKCSNC